MAAIEIATSNTEITKKQTRSRAVVYPTGDGKPLGEDEIHVREIVNAIQFLRFWFRDRHDVYVMGNNFVYWHEGFPKKRVSPDCYVAFGVEERIRPSYKSWEENGILPSVVLEITSRSTRQRDTDYKFNLYEQVWQAQEYYMFDPARDYLRVPLQGYTLVNGRYQPMALEDDRIYSSQLGLQIVMQGSNLRFFDPVAHGFVPTLAEAAARTHREVQRAEEERQRAEEEHQRVMERDAEIARMRAELAELRRKYGESS